MKINGIKIPRTIQYLCTHCKHTTYHRVRAFKTDPVIARSECCLCNAYDSKIVRPALTTDNAIAFVDYVEPEWNTKCVA